MIKYIRTNKNLILLHLNDSSLIQPYHLSFELHLINTNLILLHLNDNSLIQPYHLSFEWHLFENIHFYIYGHLILMELWRWGLISMELWRWGRWLFKQEDMKEEGFFFLEMKGRRLLWGNGEGCCDEIEKAVVVKFVMKLRRWWWWNLSTVGGRLTVLRILGTGAEEASSGFGIKS